MKDAHLTIRDLVNAPFEFNCYVDIYDPCIGDTWNEGNKVAELFNMCTTNFDELPDEVLDSTIKYVTTDGDRIVIEI